jgi:hypothetical protein
MRALAMAPFMLALGACDTQQTVENSKQMAEDVSDASRKVADATVDGTKQTIDGTRRAVDDVTALADGKAERAASMYAAVTDTGQLSQSATGWIEARAREQGGTLEQIIVKGAQVAPVALEVGRVLNQAVERDTAIEPIYQKIDDTAASADLDAAIGDMPRVEVIDGLTVGIRRLDTLKTNETSKERAYLVTWRQADHLVGFLYRSTRTIDIDKLVSDLPPLVRATRAVLQTTP